MRRQRGQKRALKSHVKLGELLIYRGKQKHGQNAYDECISGELLTSKVVHNEKLTLNNGTSQRVTLEQ